MEAVNFGHSVKDIPIPSKKEYQKMMINSYENFIWPLRWKVFHFFNPNSKSKKETYGFKSLKFPQQFEELKDFEEEFRDLIVNIEFKDHKNAFQEKLAKEKEDIEKESKLIVGADKTSNFYKVDHEEYKELVKKTVEAEYKKETKKNVEKVNQAHKRIVNNLEIQDRVFKTTERECFVTLKDHKPAFKNNPKCRLLNPMKCELGKVSKQVLTEKINTLRQKTQLIQWKNVYSVIDWFKALKNKKSLKFIQFDVVSYYPSITSELLVRALKWAQDIVEITAEEINIMVETKRSLLYLNGEAWTKKGDENFDVAQGAYDSAEICDIVGLFLLSELKKQNINATLGIYRDDGLGVSSATPRQVDKIKKQICEVYKRHGLSLTVENLNKKVVQFLDVELDLENDTFKPYIKENDVPLYVHCDSNHPPAVTKNIPLAVNKRLSALSSNEEMFQSVAPIYQAALDKAGYKYKLKYDPECVTAKKKNRKRKRDELWFNPPYCATVKTNVGAKFLKLISKHFPKTNPLHKVINRRNTKVSYRTTANMKKVISSHNKKIPQKN